MSDLNKTFIIQPIITLSEDSFLSGTTFDNNTIYYNMSDAPSAFTTNLNSLVIDLEGYSESGTINGGDLIVDLGNPTGATINIDDTLSTLTLNGDTIKFLTNDAAPLGASIWTKHEESTGAGVTVTNYQALDRDADSIGGWYPNALIVNDFSNINKPTNGVSADFIQMDSEGSGSTQYFYGRETIVRKRGGGDIGFLNGHVTRLSVDGTEISSVSTVMRGVSPDVKVDNPNATVSVAQGMHPTINLSKGTIGSAQIMYLDYDLNLSGGTNHPNLTITGDISYIEAGNDGMGSLVVGGKKRFIKYTGNLESDLNGIINTNVDVSIIEAGTPKVLTTKEWVTGYTNTIFYSAGNNGEIQFNNNGSFGASSGLTYIDNTLSIDGNVGVGLTNPTRKFQVKPDPTRAGTIYITNNTALGVSPALVLESFSQDNSYKLGSDNSGTLRLLAPNNTTIFQGSNLGFYIPRVIIDNNAGTVFSPSITMDRTDGQETGFYLPSGLGSNTLGFITQRTERMRINSTGNVSIGTTNSSGRLTIDGVTTSPFISLPTVPSGSTNSAIQFGSPRTGGSDALIGGDVQNGQDLLYFTGGGTVRHTISNTPNIQLIQSTNNGINLTAAAIFSRSGTGNLGWNFRTVDNGHFVVETANVGIGTLTPTEKLEVSGSILANSYKVSGGTSNDILLGDGSTTSLGDLNIKEENVVSTVVEPTIISGSYTFDTTQGKFFVATLTEVTTINMPTLDNSTAIAFTAIIKGNHTLLLPNCDITPSSDDYDGTVRNRLIFDCYKLSNGIQVNNVSIENLTT